MKIIGGEFRNRELKSPNTSQTRPTLAVMRKATFDILQERIEGASFLDLFAGSGAMGLEALSRGASHAAFVESSPQAMRCIEENIAKLGVKPRSTLLGYDCFVALKKLTRQAALFDIIYADPPYSKDLHHEIIEYMDAHPLLKPGGTLFLEEAAPPKLLEGLTLKRMRHVDTRTFSRSALHQFRMAG